MINIYCFFGDHDTWLLLLEYFLQFVQCLRFLKGCLDAILQLSYHLQEYLETKNKKQTHTHLTVFFLTEKIRYLKKFVEFYFAERNSAEIYTSLKIYSIKIYSFKVIQRS